MHTIRPEDVPRPACKVLGCLDLVYELEPGLPTLFCDRHRAMAVAESNKLRGQR